MAWGSIIIHKVKNVITIKYTTTTLNPSYYPLYRQSIHINPSYTTKLGLLSVSWLSAKLVTGQPTSYGLVTDHPTDGSSAS